MKESTLVGLVLGSALAGGAAYLLTRKGLSMSSADAPPTTTPVPATSPPIIAPAPQKMAADTSTPILWQPDNVLASAMLAKTRH